MFAPLLLLVAMWQTKAGQHGHHPKQSAPLILEMGQRKLRKAAGGESAAWARSLLATEILPVFPGYGTHFAYIYVGTPPQRQSVIVDTGSHYTAFPCAGCSQCGQHTDQYWDLKNSSTATVPKCQNQPCVISQSYSEGSSWRAIKVVDKLWVGGLDRASVSSAPAYSIDFLFGCQTSETGLFRTQLADGIMGMGIAADTVPSQLVAKGVTTSKVFALCFRIGGGIMTLGGVDPRIHTKPQIFYAKLAKSSGWYNVNVLDIFLVHRDTKERKSLGQDKSVYQSGKGSIVDSGTTDTYLPQSVASKFQSLFQELSGVVFTQANTPLTQAQLDKMPNLVFVLEDVEGKSFEVSMPWNNYVDSVGGGKYAFRIYLTENSGAVLGANFMSGYNVIFDVDGAKVGFSKSECKYEDYVETPTINVLPTRQPTTFSTGANSSTPGCSGVPGAGLVAISECTARCSDLSSPAYTASGSQVFVDPCSKTPTASITKACHQPCNLNKVVRGDPKCPTKAWLECSKSCIQSRAAPYAEDLAKGSCKYTQQTRTCNTGDCPTADGDYLVFVDLRVMIYPSTWSYVHAEAFYCAIEQVLGVGENAIDLLNNAGNEYTTGVKLHFELRLKSQNFADMLQFRKYAQSIPDMVWGPSFSADLINGLEACSKKTDGLDFSRFGYMLPHDVEILNAVAMPMGGVRDPIEVPDETGSIIIKYTKGVVKNQFELLLVGVALTALLCCLCAVWGYFRMRREYAEWEKDKEGSLGRIYASRFRAWSRGHASAGYKQVVMSELAPEAEGEGEAGTDSAIQEGEDDLDALKA